MPNAMLDPGSYFPPVDTWSRSRLPSPAPPEPAPLLPTPIPSAMPSTLGGTLNEVPPHVADLEAPIQPPPTCSCPVTDTCIAESLALLLGSFKLLHRIVLELQDPVAGRPSHAFRGEKDTARSLALLISRFELCIIKLLAPLLDAEGLDVADLLLQQWLRPVLNQEVDDNVCVLIRRKIDKLLINVVDTFPPMQHTLHMLLVRYDFGSARFQSMFDALRDQKVDIGPDTKLLLEANRQLAQFSVRSDSEYKQALLDDLQSRVDGLVQQVDKIGSETAMNGRKL